MVEAVGTAAHSIFVRAKLSQPLGEKIVKQGQRLGAGNGIAKIGRRAYPWLPISQFGHQFLGDGIWGKLPVGRGLVIRRQRLPVFLVVVPAAAHRLRPGHQHLKMAAHVPVEIFHDILLIGRRVGNRIVTAGQELAVGQDVYGYV